jgi:hypothetical protein
MTGRITCRMPDGAEIVNESGSTVIPQGPDSSRSGSLVNGRKGTYPFPCTTRPRCSAARLSDDARDFE